MALWHVCREEFFSGYAEFSFQLSVRFSVRIMDENAGDIRGKTKGEIGGQSRV